MNQAFNTTSHQPRRVRGVALILVLAVIAIASILGFAMLSAGALQSQAGSNAVHATGNQYLAESAVQAALYYLQYPQFLPPGWGDTPGYYIHATNQSLPPFPGTFDLIVVPTGSRNVYGIRATAKPTTGEISRVVTATASVDRNALAQAGIFGGNTIIPLGVNVYGAVQVNGSFLNLSTTLITTVLLAPLQNTAFQTPTSATINYFGADNIEGKYVTPEGTIGYAQRLLEPPTTPPVAAVNNPGNIFYYKNDLAADLVLTAPVTINGTLIVKNGGLSVRTGGVVITPEPGYPGLVLDGALNMYRTNARLTVNGVAYVGQSITWTGPLYTGTQLNIEGALIMPSGSVINSPGLGAVANVTFAAAKADVPDLTRTPQPGNSVKLLAWNE